VSCTFFLYSSLLLPNNDYTLCITSYRCFFNIYPPEFTPYWGGLVQSFSLNDSACANKSLRDKLHTLPGWIEFLEVLYSKTSLPNSFTSAFIALNISDFDTLSKSFNINSSILLFCLSDIFFWISLTLLALSIM